VKLREYPPKEKPKLTLEFKLREKDYGTRELQEGVTGAVEAWRKWSSATLQSAKNYMRMVGEQRWFKVAKARRLARYSVRGETVTRVPNSERIVSGCGFELTDLRVQSGKDAQERWISVCFEAFTSEGDDMMAILGATVKRIAQVPPPASLLRMECSYSYPKWLDRL
jgi:hypothetical protein